MIKIYYIFFIILILISLSQQKSLDSLKNGIKGKTWVSISVESRPGPQFLKRWIKFPDEDSIEAVFTNYADAYGQKESSKLSFKGSIKWMDENPVADGAYNVQFVIPDFNYAEYDLLYLNDGFLYFGAKPADGSGTVEKIPVALQIPLIEEGEQIEKYSLDELKDQIIGKTWSAQAIEQRPRRLPNGKIVDSFSKRLNFKYNKDGSFSGQSQRYFDSLGQKPSFLLDFSGHINWGGESNAAPGAQYADHILDTSFELTPVSQEAVDILNTDRPSDQQEWKLNEKQDMFKKDIPQISILNRKDRIYTDYDLIFVYKNHFFHGARHPDGRTFDKAENRPTNLQIDLISGTNIIQFLAMSLIAIVAIIC